MSFRLVPLRFSAPVAAILVDPVPVIVPLVQVNVPVVVTALLPVSVPPDRVVVVVLIAEALLKFATPLEIVSGLPTLVTVPVKFAVPPVTSVVPVTL